MPARTGPSRIYLRKVRSVTQQPRSQSTHKAKTSSRDNENLVFQMTTRDLSSHEVDNLVGQASSPSVASFLPEHLCISLVASHALCTTSPAPFLSAPHYKYIR
ncbi:hypothetical protein NPIL_256471 [Nephila pilipes]|uniref:Uncharacterized protein n=1 Tax=Nephila pilipes TaxID=299642 RepID=A0A8X6UKJ4_NEPPI|nr:hypothetical protein NPIL_256471 [Nephila pilipes]